MSDRHVTNEATPFAMVPEALAYDPTLSDKAVRLYVVLRRHGDDPSNCYPSKRRLADLMGCAATSIGRPLRELEDAGWITRVPRTKPTGEPDSNGYHVHVARTSSAGYAQENSDPPRSGAMGVGAQERAERESVNETQRNEIDTPAPALELIAPSEPEPDEVLDAFDAWWARYPRKVAKPEAWRAWRSVVEKPRVHPTTVMEGLDRWLAYWRAKATEAEFVPHPSTWLRQERWKDEPPPVTAGRGAPTTGPRAPVTSRREGTSGRVYDL